MLPKNSPYKIIDDTTWPKANQGDLEWLLRYGHDEDILKKRWVLASIVGAYGEMVSLTQKRRNHVCGKLKEEL